MSSAPHGPLSPARLRPDVRHVTFPTPRAFYPPLNLAPPASPSRTSAADAGSAEPTGGAGPDDPSEYVPSFGDWLFHQAGLNPDCYKSDSLGRRVPACLRALRVDTTSRARSLLRRRPELVPVAVDAVLVGVTQFFRDADTFETLARDVLPERVRHAAARGTPLRVWSAGCSTGKELYSVAMLLADLGPAAAKAALLGTDARRAAIDAARQGRFRDEAVRAIPPHLRDRHLSRESGAAAEWRVSDAVRQRIQWRTGDLFAGAEPGPWDLVLCRNVAIYLRPEAATRLWRCLSASLRPGGYLVLGRAERPSGALGLERVGPSVYRRPAEPASSTADRKPGGTL